jgi:hypothetical protein
MKFLSKAALTIAAKAVKKAAIRIVTGKSETPVEVIFEQALKSLVTLGIKFIAKRMGMPNPTPV